MSQTFTITDTDTGVVISLDPIKASQVQSALAGWMLSLVLNQQNENGEQAQ